MALSQSQAQSLFTKAGRYTDTVVNAFVKTNLRFTNNNLLKFQDPLYIGFKLFFLFDQPNSGLLSTEAHPNTAMGYLERRGETVRMGYLKKFVELLKGINSECPWFWQSIEGLDEAWKHGYNEEDFKARVPKDRKITINCLDESIDFRLTALMDLYRKACFDWTTRREVVPRNLRYFTVSVYCYEARSINRDVALNLGAGIKGAFQGENFSKDGLKDGLTKDFKDMENLLGKDPALFDPITKNVESINDTISRVMFDFNYCEFLPDESNSTVAAISHKEMGLKAQKIVFNYGNVAEDNIYRMFHEKPVTDVILGALDNLAFDNINQADTIARVAFLKAAKFAKSKLNSLFLGNVYGFSPLSITNATGLSPQELIDNPGSALMANPNALVKPLKDATRAIANSIKNDKEGQPMEKNIFATTDPALKNNTTDSTGNIGNYSPGSISLTNNTTDTTQIGNYIPGSISITNGTDVNPSGNYIPGSISLQNGTDIDPTGNYGLGSPSIPNGADQNPSGNYVNPQNPSLANKTVDKLNGQLGNSGTGSDSINNGKDQDPSGNYGTNSTSINNGKDINPSGNAYK